MLAGADAAGVNLAALTGENAAENNALFMLAIPYLITALDLGMAVYDIYDVVKEIEEAGGDEAAARQVLAARLQEWYDEGGLLWAIVERAFPTLKIADKSVDTIKEALEALGGNPLDKLYSSMAAVSPTLSNMVDAKVQSSVAKGELPEGVASGSSGAFNPKYWTHEVQFQGNRVFQRDDLIDPDALDGLNRTNLERMQAGLAPIGPDGESINLHHLIQRQNGAIAEVTRTMHYDYYSTLHINPNSIPSGIDRDEFDAWRKAYWMSRANDFDSNF